MIRSGLCRYIERHRTRDRGHGNSADELAAILDGWFGFHDSNFLRWRRGGNSAPSEIQLYVGFARSMHKFRGASFVCLFFFAWLLVALLWFLFAGLFLC